ncbi:hypothetical protein N9Y75_04845 [Candidatus Poseidoniales archaeon]|nr:hypothetical protein [Candidatus Poseidoniales archaeon]
MHEEVFVTDSEEIQESHSYATRRILYMALGSTLAFMLYSLLVLAPAGKCFKVDEGSNSLGLTFSYTLGMVQEFFESRSTSQLDCYSEFLQIWDVIFAIIYTSMYCFWILYFFQNRRILLVIPLLGMVADWSENIVEIMMIDSYLDSSTISETLVSIGSGLNMFKWIMSTLTYLVIFAGIGIKIKSVMNRSKISES